MKFITTTEAGRKWNLSARRVGILCGEDRIPEDAEKPADARIKSGKCIKKCEGKGNA